MRAARCSSACVRSRHIPSMCHRHCATPDARTPCQLYADSQRDDHPPDVVGFGGHCDGRQRSPRPVHSRRSCLPGRRHHLGAARHWRARRPGPRLACWANGMRCRVPATMISAQLPRAAVEDRCCRPDARLPGSRDDTGMHRVGDGRRFAETEPVPGTRRRNPGATAHCVPIRITIRHHRPPRRAGGHAAGSVVHKVRASSLTSRSDDVLPVTSCSVRPPSADARRAATCGAQGFRLVGAVSRHQPWLWHRRQVDASMMITA